MLSQLKKLKLPWRPVWSLDGVVGIVIGAKYSGKTTLIEQGMLAERKAVVLEEGERPLERRPRTYPPGTEEDSVPYTAAALDGDPKARLTILDTKGELIFEPRVRDEHGEPQPTTLQVLGRGIGFITNVVAPSQLVQSAGTETGWNPERLFERQLAITREAVSRNRDVMVSIVYTMRDRLPAFEPAETRVLERPVEQGAFGALGASGRTDAAWQAFLDVVTGPEGGGTLSEPRARREILERSRRLWDGLAAMNHPYVRGYFVSALPCDEVGTECVRSAKQEDEFGCARVFDDIRDHWKQTHARPSIRPWMIATAAGAALVILATGSVRRTQSRSIDDLNAAIGKLHSRDHEGLDVVAFDTDSLERIGLGHRPPTAWLDGDPVARLAILKRVNGAYNGLLESLSRTSGAPEGRSPAGMLKTANAELTAFRRWAEAHEGLLEREARLLDKTAGNAWLLRLLTRLRDDMTSVVSVLECASRSGFGPDDFEDLQALLAEASGRLAGRRRLVPGTGGNQERATWDDLVEGSLRPMLGELVVTHARAYTTFLRSHERAEVALTAELAGVSDDPYRIIAAAPRPASEGDDLAKKVEALKPPIDVVVVVDRGSVTHEADLLTGTVRVVQGLDRSLSSRPEGTRT